MLWSLVLDIFFKTLKITYFVQIVEFTYLKYVDSVKVDKLQSVPPSIYANWSLLEPKGKIGIILKPPCLAPFLSQQSYSNHLVLSLFLHYVANMNNLLISSFADLWQAHRNSKPGKWTTTASHEERKMIQCAVAKFGTVHKSSINWNLSI